MHRILLAVLIAALASPTLAGTEAEDRAQFAAIIEVCAANPEAGRTLGACVAEQVDSTEYFLGDLLAETATYLDADAAARMAAAQAAWTAYLTASCDYQARMLPKVAMAESLCRLRLIAARTIELRAFDRFADPAGED